VQHTEDNIQKLLALVEINSNEPISETELLQTTQRVREGGVAIQAARQRVAERVEEVARHQLALDQLKADLREVSVSVGVVVGREQAAQAAKGSLRPVCGSARSIRIEAAKSFNEAMRCVNACGGRRLTGDELENARKSVMGANDVVRNGIERLEKLQGWGERWAVDVETNKSRVQKSADKLQTLRCLLKAVGEKEEEGCFADFFSLHTANTAVQEAADLVDATMKEIVDLNRFCNGVGNRRNKTNSQDSCAWMSDSCARSEEERSGAESDDDDDDEDDDDDRIKALWTRLQPRTHSSSNRKPTDKTVHKHNNKSESSSRKSADEAMKAVQQSCMSVESAIDAAQAALQVEQSARHERVRVSRELDTYRLTRQNKTVCALREKHSARTTMRKAAERRLGPLRDAVKELRGFADAALIEAESGGSSRYASLLSTARYVVFVLTHRFDCIFCHLKKTNISARIDS
jgi:hypothetical protein